MKLIIAGSRDIQYLAELTIENIISYFMNRFKIKEVVSGGARGVDACGLDFAKTFDIKVTIFKPDWEQYGKAAGPIRNRQMAEYADALLLIWDGKSKGSKNMKEEMSKLSKPVYEVILKKH